MGGYIRVQLKIFILKLTILMLMLSSCNLNVNNVQNDLFFLPQWNYNIVAYQEESIHLALPFYTHFHDDLDPKEISVILPQNEITLLKFEVTKQVKSDTYQQYSLDLLIAFNKPLELNDYEFIVQLETNKGKTLKNVMLFNGSIVEDEFFGEIDVKNYIPFIVTESPIQNFPYEFTLNNNSDKDIIISEIVSPDSFEVTESNVDFPYVLRSGEEIAIELTVKSSVEKLYSFKPALLMSINNRISLFTLPNLIVALNPSPKYLSSLLSE